LLPNMSNILTLPDSDASLLEKLAEEFRLGFEEFVDSAEKELSGKHFVFSRYGKELYPYFESSGATSAPGCIIPIKEGRPVVSVDSTCVLVGESPDGSLYASRAAVGISHAGALKRFMRLGPLFVYISEHGVSGIKADPSPVELDLLLSDHAVAERFVRNTIERRVVESLMRTEGEVIVMADGSLKHPFGQFSVSLPARSSGGCLVGFSKSSNLIFSEREVSSLSASQFPAYFQMDDGDVKTVLAKFSSNGLVFRLDIANTDEPPGVVLGRILWNDSFSAGYPESLKVAHHLSVFTKADDQALKAFVTGRFRVRRLSTVMLRSVALGCFRGGA
jgi:hypothetical protein